MKHSKHVLLGIGATVIAFVLFSFSTGDHETKKKKYHVIHQEDGVMHEYDTILPANSTYSVDDFLAAHGISSENVKIIRIPGEPARKMVFTDGESGEKHVFIHHTDEEMVDGGEHTIVKITREVNENGEEVITKSVNGSEVTLSESEKDEIRSKKGNDVRMRKEVRKGHPKGENREVELKVEVDEKGVINARKIVNGKEVELTEEELENIHLQHETMGKNQLVLIETGDPQSIEDIEVLVQEEGSEGEQRIIIREIITSEGTTKDGGDGQHMDFHFESAVDMSGGDEDFTVVIVTENVQEEDGIQTQTKTRTEQLNDPINIYPNPNTGTFTIAFQQAEKASTSLEITDVQGKVVFSEDLGTFSGNYKKELNLKRYGSGIYVVTVKQGNEVSSKKLIIE